MSLGAGISARKEIRFYRIRLQLLEKCPMDELSTALIYGFWPTFSENTVYTPSKVYAKRISSGTLLALLLVSALIFLLPTTAVVRGSTGTAQLASVDLSGDHIAGAHGIELSNVNESVYAGTSAVKYIGNGTTNYNPGADDVFAVVFNGVTFNGAQFNFYISTNGYSQINTTKGETSDISYGPTFYKANFTANCATACIAVNGTGTVPGVGKTTFYEGTYQGYKVVIGIIPIRISTAYKYIKIYDGTSTAVAVASEYIAVLPGITVDPSSGAAGIAITVSGGGFGAKTNIALNYTYDYWSWKNTESVIEGTLTSSVTNKGGWFSYDGHIVDVKQAVTPPGHGSNAYTTPILLTAVNGSKLSQAITSGAGNAVFTEWNRIFNQVTSSFHGTYYKDSPGPYGNGTESEPGYSATVPVLEAFVTGSIGIEGNYTYAGSTVTVTLGANTKTVTSNTISGHFIANITVPDLPIGYQTVKVSSDGVAYYFSIYVEPTLVLTPYSGPTSGCVPTGSSATCNTDGTTVTVAAYGFKADKIIWIYWDSIRLYDGLAFNVANATTNSAGSFTSTASFKVPNPTFGGVHEVYAVANSTTTYPGHNATIGTIEEYYTSSATFTVTPSLVATPSTLNSNQPGFINVHVEGLTPGQQYMIEIDHALYSYIYGLDSDGYTGNGRINFTSSGFTPGLQQIEITPIAAYFYYSGYYYYSENNYSTPAAWTYFNVTTTGDYISNEIAGISGSVTTAANKAFATFSSEISNIQTAVDTSIPTDITTSQTAVQQSITNAVSSIQSSISNAVTTIQGYITSGDASLSSAISTVGTSASTAASEATTAATNSMNASNGSSTAQTYVLVVAVLAAITLVLELAILVRKLS